MAFIERNPAYSDAALLARRATLNPTQETISTFVGKDRNIAVQDLLALPLNGEQTGREEKAERNIEWWIDLIGRSSNGLQERMAFFWHTLIPTHRYGVGWQELIGPQINLLRAQALGNFRQLVQLMVIDGAMIRYLDADSSRAKKPNENLARELMELFTVGVGNYTETDIRQAALAMTGWRVDKDSYNVYHDPERAYTEPVTFLGETKVWDISSIVDRLCDHPATAKRVAGKIWYHFTGSYPSDGGNELGSWWQGQNLEIKPLLERVMLSDEFWQDHYVRPRSGFEYYMAVKPLLNFDTDDTWRPRNLGQLPYEPPNVGGWPEGERWLNPDSQLRRSGQMFSLDFDNVPGGRSSSLDQILDAAGLYIVSDTTLAALQNAPSRLEYVNDEVVSELSWRIALTSPEFQLT